jgi:predicted ATPase
LFHVAQHEACSEHLTKGLQLYGLDDYRGHGSLYGGHDPKVCALGEKGLALWLLGFPDRSLEASREAMAWARALAHSGSTAHAMDIRLMLHAYRRDVGSVREGAEQMIAYAEEQRLPVHRAKGMVFLGWALAEVGEAERGIGYMREGLETQKAIGTREDFPVFFEMLAGACARVGRGEFALDVLAEVLHETERTGLCYWTPELYRARGEALMSVSPENEDEADGWFRRAVGVAREQRAKSLELRAAGSLARLEQRRGRRDGARAVLAPVYAWFREGFDTVDLVEAGALLDDLGLAPH